MTDDVMIQLPAPLEGQSTSVSRVLFVLWRGTLAGLFLALCLQLCYMTFASNFHTVIPGQVYRCSQPSGRTLETFIHRHGIRTIINLRGCGINADWYHEEARVASRLGVSLEDVSCSAMRMPSALVMQQLLTVLDRSTYPVLVHCFQGADRTGMVAVMASLLHTDASLAEARRHLGPVAGHLALGRTACMDRFFDLYEQWLCEQKCTHSPDRFRTWVNAHYCPARADFTVIDPLAQTTPTRSILRLPRDKPQSLVVRCHNRSNTAWQFDPQDSAGIHLYTRLTRDGQSGSSAERLGMFQATVPPGQHIDFMLSVPALPQGRHELYVDLNDEQHGWFQQFGNDPLVIELEVP